jgi:hypothetical protein
MVLYNALSTLQAGYPNESITRVLTMFRIRGSIAGGTFATMNSLADLPKEERNNSEWIQCRESCSPVRVLDPRRLLPSASASAST